MKLHIDKEADALYLRLDDSAIVESEEVAPGVVLDYNEADQAVGIEMLYLSKRSPNLNLSTLELVKACPAIPLRFASNPTPNNLPIARAQHLRYANHSPSPKSQKSQFRQRVPKKLDRIPSRLQSSQTQQNMRQ